MRKILAVVFLCFSLAGPTVANTHRSTRTSTSTHHSHSKATKKSHSGSQTATCADGTASYSQNRRGTRSRNMVFGNDESVGTGPACHAGMPTWWVTH
jgi:hypothetical protein